jgi:hypothetical protein
MTAKMRKKHRKNGFFELLVPDTAMIVFEWF